MAAFEYIALDGSGRERKGVHEADSARQVRGWLRDQGMVPMDVTAATERRAGVSLDLTWFRQGMSVADLALMTRQLATLMRASMPLDEALRTIARQSERRNVRNIVMGVRGKVLEGFPLAAGMAEYPGAFGELYRETVSAGEQSGHLDRVLASLADYTERQQQGAQNVMVALIYPALVLLVAFGMAAFLMLGVVPDIVRVFEASQQELPWVTVLLIAFSDFLQVWGWLLLLGAAAGAFAARQLYRQADLRVRWDRYVLSLPVVGRISRGSNAAQFSGTLAILTSSGVPLVEAMRIASNVVSNRWLRGEIASATQKVSEGSALARALEGPARFPPMMLHMISAGESSGELDSMLSRIAEYQQSELERLVTGLVALLQPLTVLMMGGIVLTIVLAILLPIINLNQLVN